jgi:hypothetical protein
MMVLKASPFSEYCCIPFQPSLPYVNQAKAHFTSEAYQDKWGSLTT